MSLTYDVDLDLDLLLDLEFSLSLTGDLDAPRELLLPDLDLLLLGDRLPLDLDLLSRLPRDLERDLQ